jgi:hypothetical protein
LLATESQTGFDFLLNGLIAAWRPTDFFQYALVREIALFTWEVERFRRGKVDHLDSACADAALQYSRDQERDRAKQAKTASKPARKRSGAPPMTSLTAKTFAENFHIYETFDQMQAIAEKRRDELLRQLEHYVEVTLRIICDNAPHIIDGTIAVEDLPGGKFADFKVADDEVAVAVPLMPENNHAQKIDRHSNMACQATEQFGTDHCGTKGSKAFGTEQCANTDANTLDASLVMAPPLVPAQSKVNSDDDPGLAESNQVKADNPAHAACPDDNSRPPSAPASS